MFLFTFTIDTWLSRNYDDVSMTEVHAGPRGAASQSHCLNNQTHWLS